jgi:hypothetical protein
MSALPPKADIRYGDWHVRFVPKADIVQCGKPLPYSNRFLANGAETMGEMACTSQGHFYGSTDESIFQSLIRRRRAWPKAADQQYSLPHASL